MTRIPTAIFEKRTAERIARHVVEQERVRPGVDPTVSRYIAANEGGTVNAILTGYIRLSANRFQYIWVEANVSSIGVFSLMAGGLTSTSAGLAYNTFENRNTGFGIESSVNVNGSDYPPGFHLQPIRADTWPGGDPNPGGSDFWGASIGPAVVLHKIGADDGSIVWGFHAVNAHDGTCSSALASSSRGVSCGSRLGRDWAA